MTMAESVSATCELTVLSILSIKMSINMYGKIAIINAILTPSLTSANQCPLLSIRTHQLPKPIMSTNAIARRLEAIQTKGAMRSSEVANILNVRPETVSRWNKGKALPHAATEKQLLELEFVIDKLTDIYEPHDARLWLFSRQRLMNDQIPAEMIQQGRVDEVLATVNQLLDGVHI